MSFFHLERGGVTLSKINGFTFIEGLVAFNIVCIVLITFIPLASLIYQERANLTSQRIILNALHDELQLYLWDKNHTLPNNYSKTVNDKTIHYYFSMEDQFIEGCVKWINGKAKQETNCLYGLPMQ